jgi:RNAse (barnase) inhibitor barstar
MTGPPFLRPDPPWLHVTADHAAVEVASAAVTSAGGAVRVLRGARMRTERGLFIEAADRLDFPDYFGHNWPALQDCLTDLAWLPATAYLLVVDDAHELLVAAASARIGLLGDVLAHAGRWWGTVVADGQEWDRPARAFHAVLATTSRARRDAVTERWGEAGLVLAVL